MFDDKEATDYFNRYKFYVEQVGRLLQCLELDVYHKNIPRKKMTKKEIVKRLAYIQLSATDDEMCLDNCKNLYFCVQPKGHKGCHTDEFGFYWEQED